MTFQYDGNEAVLDRQGATSIDYINGPGIDEKLRQSGGAGGTFYFLQDHLGSVIGLVGTVNERYQYEAFGANGGSNWTRYGYTWRERDAATGMLHYRARWYDAGQGRFLSEDPIGMQGGMNLYAYVGNDPMGYSDPMRLDPWGREEWGAFGASALEGALVSGLFGMGMVTLAPVFPVAVPIIGAVMLGAGMYSLAMTLSQWAELCEIEKAAFLGGLLGSALGAGHSGVALAHPLHDAPYA